MIYEYMVKFGDTFYPAGTNVPDDEPVNEKKVEEPVVEVTPIEQAIEESVQKEADTKRKGGRPKKKA